jgi:eukaryotic-like serine/threonine-protein kinase
MEESTHSSDMGHRIRFGPFELDRQTGELRREGVTVKLQSRPRQILMAMLERPGERISRNELKQRLWSDDTFVDFESGLNTAVNRLRLALGDSAEDPRYIQTQARAGYRFIAEIEDASESPHTDPSPARERQRAQRKRLVRWAVPAACLLIAAAIFWWSLRRPATNLPQFKQVTFGRGAVGGARFTLEGHTILYSAKWESQPWRVFQTNLGSPEARMLGFDGNILSAVSSFSELSLISSEQEWMLSGGTLSRVPLNGGVPREFANRITFSDWSPDGKNLAVIRFNGGDSQLEFPVGRVRYRASGLLSHLRVSRDGQRIAFLEHPVRGEDGGDVKVLESSGKIRTLAAGWATAGSLAWSASGGEVWFTAARAGERRALWAVTLRGKLRMVWRGPGSVDLQDISRDGRVLLTQEDRRLQTAGRAGDMTVERDLSWFDWSMVHGISADGSVVLFDETGEGGGANGATYLWRVREDSVLRLGEGYAQALSPDGRSALVLDESNRQRLKVLSVGEGQARELSGDGIEYHGATFFPDGKRVLILGNEPGHPVHFYIQPIEGGKPQSLAHDIFLRSVFISPDGTRIAGADRDNHLIVMPVDGGDPKLFPTPYPLLVAGWDAGGISVFARDIQGVSARLYRVDLASGRSTPWKELGPSQPAGVLGILRMYCMPDEKSYAYSYYRNMAQLYVTKAWAN